MLVNQNIREGELKLFVFQMVAFLPAVKYDRNWNKYPKLDFKN